jgi:hypothetical protein
MALDFFISCEDVDRPWAEWIGWTLESFGYSTVVLLKDLDPAAPDYYKKMHNALTDSKAFIAVYSYRYAHSERWPAEWHTAYVKDPLGEKSLFIPVRIEGVKKEGLLVPFESVDLFGLSEEQARVKCRNTLLRAFTDIRTETAPKDEKPPFPGSFKTYEAPHDEDRIRDEAEAVNFLVKKTKLAADKNASLVAERLKYSSKRLANAAQYICENSISYAECITILSENGDDVFDNRE